MVGTRPLLREGEEMPGGELNWLGLCGADDVWHPANAVVQGETVLVTSETVSEPEAVRNACHVQPQGGNLYHRAGQTASRFCSDLAWLPWQQP